MKLFWGIIIGLLAAILIVAGVLYWGSSRLPLSQKKQAEVMKMTGKLAEDAHKAFAVYRGEAKSYKKCEPPHIIPWYDEQVDRMDLYNQIQREYQAFSHEAMSFTGKLDDMSRAEFKDRKEALVKKGELFLHHMEKPVVQGALTPAFKKSREERKEFRKTLKRLERTGPGLPSMFGK